MRKYCSDNNIEQKFCPVGDHRGCGLVKRTIQTFKRRLMELLKANSRWNQTRRDTSANDLRRTVEEASTINPELQKEMLYSWERGFVEDKLEDIVNQRQWSPILLRTNEGRKSGKALTKPLKGKVVAETPSTVKTAAGSIYRKSDKNNHRCSPTGEEPKKKQQKQPQRQPDDQEEADNSGSEEDLLLEQRSIDPVEAQQKFQDSPTVVTSKDILQGGGLNLAVKRAKPNMAAPFTKTSKPKGGTGAKDSQPTNLQNMCAAAAVEEEPQACSSNSAGAPKSTSTPHSSTKSKKKISRNTSPETILDTFNSKDLTAADWNRLADQVLERGVQRTAADILHSKENAEEGEDSNNPPGFSDESEVEETSVRKSGRSKKGPIRYGNPIKHSVRSISYHNDLLDLNQAALEVYRIKLAKFKPNASNSVETKFGLLEKHLFRTKFGSEALDINRSWNDEWWLPLQLEEEHEEKDGK